MQSLSEIRDLLAQRGVRPKRRLGQHFLHDKNQIARLLQAADLGRGELVLEIGPGTGTLTEGLLEAGAEVVACEVDPVLADLIADRFGDAVRLIRGDCLQRRSLNPEVARALGPRPFKLVANLPYHVASPLICTLLIDHPACAGQYVTIQKEVADRLLAEPGTKVYGALTIIVGALATLDRIGVVRPTSFWPPPNVISAMVSIAPQRELRIDDPAVHGKSI